MGGPGPPAVAPRAAAGRRAHSLSRTTGPAVAVVSGARPSPHVIFQPASTVSESATRLVLYLLPLVLALLLCAGLVARLRAGFDRERALARLDQLTGVPNVRAFYDLAAVEIERARRYQHPFTVAFIDLDEFKLVNGHLGRTAGDAVLGTVARTISAETRASDVVARVGGDEFVVLFPETGTAPARLAIEKVRQAVSGIVPAHGWRPSARIRGGGPLPSPPPTGRAGGGGGGRAPPPPAARTER